MLRLLILNSFKRLTIGATKLSNCPIVLSKTSEETLFYSKEDLSKHVISYKNLHVADLFIKIVVIAFVVCSIYFRLTDDPTDPTASYDRNGALFFLGVSQFMMSMMGILLTFPSEREVFLRETGSNMYGVTSYFFGRSSTEIPFVTLIPFIFSCIIYWIIGFNNAHAGKFFIFGNNERLLKHHD